MKITRSKKLRSSSLCLSIMTLAFFVSKCRVRVIQPSSEWKIQTKTGQVSNESEALTTESDTNGADKLKNQMDVLFVCEPKKSEWRDLFVCIERLVCHSSHATYSLVSISISFSWKESSHIPTANCASVKQISAFSVQLVVQLTVDIFEQSDTY